MGRPMWLYEIFDPANFFAAGYFVYFYIQYLKHVSENSPFSKYIVNLSALRIVLIKTIVPTENQRKILALF